MTPTTELLQQMSRDTKKAFKIDQKINFKNVLEAIPMKDQSSKRPKCLFRLLPKESRSGSVPYDFPENPKKEIRLLIQNWTMD